MKPNAPAARTAWMQDDNDTELLARIARIQVVARRQIHRSRQLRDMAAASRAEYAKIRLRSAHAALEDLDAAATGSSGASRVDAQAPHSGKIANDHSRADNSQPTPSNQGPRRPRGAD